MRIRKDFIKTPQSRNRRKVTFLLRESPGVIRPKKTRAKMDVLEGQKNRANVGALFRDAVFFAKFFSSGPAGG